MARKNVLEGKVVVITGACAGRDSETGQMKKPGIGLRTARRLKKLGAKPYLMDINPEVQEVAEELGCPWKVADVTNCEAMEQAAREIREEMGAIDIVFVNAGIADPVTFEGDPAVFDRVMKVNVYGVFYTIRAFLPFIRESKGYILTNSSMGGVVRLMLMAEAYGASKAASATLGHAADLELIGTGACAGVLYLAEHDSSLEDVFYDSVPQQFMKNNPKLYRGHKARDPEKAAARVVWAMENRAQYAFEPRYTAGGAHAPIAVNRVSKWMHENVQPTVERVRDEYQASLAKKTDGQ